LTPFHFYSPFAAPLGISRVPTKQRGKKQGKGIVNRSDGFVSVDRKQSFGALIHEP
jgi:hypothetical protein